jgi:hypothetical protein
MMLNLPFFELVSGSKPPVLVIVSFRNRVSPGSRRYLLVSQQLFFVISFEQLPVSSLALRITSWPESNSCKRKLLNVLKIPP